MQELQIGQQTTESTRFEACGVVSLLTDFGLEDAYVGVLHAVIEKNAEDLRVIDLSHGVAAQDIAQAGWYLRTSYDYFAEGSVHLAIVDPGVGTERRVLAALYRGHVFLAPDNGLLGYVLGREALVRSVDVERYALPELSNTFHGRDVFAPVAAALASGAAFEQLGPLVSDWQVSQLPSHEVDEAGGLTTEVLFADRFGNLITPLAAELLSPGGEWCVELAGREFSLCSTYADVASGEALGLIGSSGTLEVSVRDGRASAVFDARRGTKIRVRRYEA